MVLPSGYDITFEGNVTNTNNDLKWTKGAGTITFAGSADQTIDLNDLTIEDVVVNKSAGNLVLTTGCTTDSFTGTSTGTGDFDPNGQTINVVGNCSWAAAFLFDSAAACMNGCTWDIGGNFTADGQTLNATATWYLYVDGTAVASGTGEVEYCDASDGAGSTEIDASAGPWTDGGNNDNWNFTPSGITATPSPAAVAWSAPTPTTAKSTSPSPAVATWSAPTPTAAKSTTPSPAVATWSAPTPAVAKSTTASPAAVAWSAPTPTAAKRTAPHHARLAWSAPDVLDVRIQAEITRRTDASPAGDFLSTLADYGMGESGGLSWTEPAGGFTRNTACWAFDLDTSGLGSYYGASGRWYLGTLISPRHMLAAWHTYGLAASDPVYFINAAGQVHQATVAATQRVDIANSDHRVVYFTADVPAGYNPYKVCPSNYDSYLTYNAADLADIGNIVNETGLYGKPQIIFDQQRKALLGRLHRIAEPSTDLEQTNSYNYGAGSNYPEREAYWPASEGLIIGDSGGANMLLVDGELVLVALNWIVIGLGGFHGVASSSVIKAVIQTEINAAMADLDTGSTGYQLTAADFSTPALAPPTVTKRTTPTPAGLTWSAPTPTAKLQSEGIVATPSPAGLTWSAPTPVAVLRITPRSIATADTFVAGPAAACSFVPTPSAADTFTAGAEAAQTAA
jgi:hypothetical protein